MPYPLSIILDPSQERLSRDGLSCLVSGRDWDPANWTDIWVDPVTNTCMLRPAPKYPDWATSNTGIFAKWGLSDFTLTPSTGWLSHNVDQGGAFMYYNALNSGGLSGVGPTLGVNQPIVIDLFSQGATNAPYGILDIGWSNTGDSTAGIAVRFYADGSADVYKGGYLSGHYAGGGSSPNYFDSALATGKTLGGGSTPMAPRGYQTIMLIPCRDRELLVISSMGGSFCHIFQDLAEGTPGLTITPGEKFWFRVQPQASANLRFAKLQYAASGYVCGVQSNWRLDPPSGDPAFEVFQSLSQAGASLATASAITPSGNPFDVANPIQIKVILTRGSAPDWTPFVYGARAYFNPQTANSTGSALELLPYVTGFHLDVSDTIGGTRASISLKQPAAIEAAGGVAITTQCHRPIQVSDEVGMMVNGVAEPPHWTDAYGFTSDGSDQNQSIEIELRDLWKLAEEYVFSDPIPLDGLSLSDAYILVATMIGFPLDRVYVSPSATDFNLPWTAASGGDWAFLCDIGDKGSEILDRLHQTYAATWFHGFRPNRATPSSPPILSLIDPSDTTPNYALPTTASVTLYPSVTMAGASWNTVYRSYRTQVLEPEANDISVIGRDPRGGKPIVAHRADTASQAVGTSPSARPANWLGTIRKYGWIDPAITTMTAAQYAISLLRSRLMIAREIIEFECEYLPGVWRGDLVTLIRPAADPVTVRIKTFSGSFENVGTFGDSDSADAVWRPCRYVGEVGTIVCPLDVHGTSVQAIGRNWNTLKALSKQRIVDGGEIIARRPVLNQQEG